MGNEPLVSIVLPTYNGEKYIKKALDAIINQTYTNWELIIVNDCSTDSTQKIIQEYTKKDIRIRAIYNDVNKKLPASLNRGFKEANGEYYTWTSDDNEYYPEAIKKMVTFLNRNLDFGMVYARTNVEKDDKIEPYIWCDKPTTPETLLSLCVPGACFMYRASVAKLIGEYDTNCFLNEDHDYWLRVLLNSNIYNLKDVLYLYRLTSTSLTNTRQSDIIKGKILLLRKYRKIYSNKFPEIKDIYRNELLFDNYIKNEITWKNCKKQIKRGILYTFLKNEYIFITQDKKYLINISCLGFLYLLRAIILYFKGKLWK